jgi:hypothetical protein
VVEVIISCEYVHNTTNVRQVVDVKSILNNHRDNERHHNYLFEDGYQINEGDEDVACSFFAKKLSVNERIVEIIT